MAFPFFWTPINFTFGSFGDDTIPGTDGRDFVFGLFGDDTIDTGLGNDRIWSGFGDDVVDAGDGRDRVWAGFGDDIVTGGLGNDRLDGGRGFDTAVFSGTLASYAVGQFGNRVTVDGADGFDVLHDFEALQFDDRTVFIDGRNNGPVAEDDAVDATENGVSSFAAADLLDNDSDFDGDTLTITGVSATSAVGASVTLSGGSVDYDPGTVFDGLGEGETTTDTFTYTVEDGNGGSAEATVTVTITGANDAPVVTVPSRNSVDENGDGIVATAAVADADGDTVMLSLGGEDAALFSIDQDSGEISFVASPDFENPQDVGGDNTYRLSVIADDGNGGVTEEALSVRVRDVNEDPVISAPATVDFAENGEGVVATATAVDPEDDGIRFSLGGVDADLFDIDTVSGEISFVAAPDFETPLDDGGDNIYDISVTANDGDGGSDTTDIAVTVTDEDETPPIVPRINEFHYDNVGGDVGEFVEVRVAAGADVADLSLVFYNGSNGSPYRTETLDGLTPGTDGTFDYYVIDLPANGIQNGSPDGIALADDGTLIEFLSYEGTIEGVGGPADMVASTDIGVAEIGTTPVGTSLQRNDDGTWRPSEPETPRAANDPVVAEPEFRINEFHYDNDGGDVGEFIEVRVTAGADASGLTLELYNGSNSSVYNTLDVPDAPASSDDDFDYYLIELPANGLQNGSPDGIALANDGTLVEFLSYEGTITGDGGVADGVLSTDVVVSEPGNTPVGQSLQRNEDGTWRGPEAETPGAANVGPAPEVSARINEVHYDDAGGDDGEFIEVRVAAGTDPATVGVTLYNGNGGAAYNTLALPDAPSTSDGEFDYYVVDATGIQNGGPDGIALTQDGTLVEFLSYEGTFTAVGGPADGEESTDIGVEETSTTAEGQSLQRNDDGTWRGPEDETRGFDNDAPPPFVGRINELHYDNAGGDTGEFVEVRVAAGVDVSQASVVLYNGNDGGSYGTIAFPDAPASSDGEFDYYVIETPGIQNGGPDGVALVNDGEVVEFLSYEGSFEAQSGPAVGLTSTDIGVEETTTTPVGQSLQRNDDGTWRGPEEETRGIDNRDGPVESFFIHEVQGSGDASALVGQDVKVEGIVTYTTSNGYYVQEEDADADADAGTSEALFVFTGSGTNPGEGLVQVGQTVEVTGTVGEFGDQTQLTGDVTTVVTNAEISALPTAVSVTVSPGDDSAAYEATEGMRVEVTSGTDDALTVTTSFNLDRFGEIIVSAGAKTQPTQLFDAQTEAAEVAALAEANANNGLIIDDGDFGQNPDEFAFLPNTSPGDDGDGILDADDNFDLGGTLRLGAEIEAPIVGIMAQAFGNYRVYATETLDIDDATNDGARDEVPDDVLGNEGGASQEDGQIVVASFNVENYFTTLGQRGATSAEDLQRQTDNLVNAIEDSGADVLALQELENTGFDPNDEIAVGALVDALNAEDPTADWQFVNPTDDNGEIGTDAITTGVIYDANAVTLVYSDVLVFEESSAQTTFETAQALSALVPGAAELSDFQRNRPAVVATFEENDTGETFTVASVHFKSKGPSGLTNIAEDAEEALANGSIPTADVAAVEAALAALQADPNFDQVDGQANWNQVRADAAAELTEWLEDEYLPAASAVDPDVGDETLILGDFNAYAREDPTQVVRDFDGADADTDADYFDIIEEFVPGGQDEAFSFVFDGQQGTLDQAFASNSLEGVITGATEWKIASQEPDLLNYDSAFNDAGFFSDDVFAASDHDPLIIGLDFNNPLVVG